MIIMMEMENEARQFSIDLRKLKSEGSRIVLGSDLPRTPLITVPGRGLD